jgi:hypothetical protein
LLGSTCTSKAQPQSPIEYFFSLSSRTRTVYGIMSLTPSPSPTQFGILTISQSASRTRDLNIPALTTIFTPGAECRGRWVRPNPEEPVVQVYSSRFTGTLTDPYYLSCQPLLSAASYSPGVCPDGHILDSTLSLYEQAYGSTTLRMFEGFVVQGTQNETPSMPIQRSLTPQTKRHAIYVVW